MVISPFEYLPNDDGGRFLGKHRTGRHDRDIQYDGRCINNAKDPPGQRSVYILPGDNRKEIYRLSTFKSFPKLDSVDVSYFAACGFYYTGYKDRVKCFSCGQNGEGWSAHDDPSLPGWHKHNCNLTTGNDRENVPKPSPNTRLCVGGTLCQSQSRPARASSAGGVLSRGLTYNNDVTMAASSRAVPSTSYSPPPTSVVMETNAVENTVNRLNPASESLVGQVDESAFPCLYPVNPHMRHEESRLQTFIDSSSIWPAHRIRATPRDIAQAGFYSLGARDRVQCWYCNGGLQNWDPDDEPWEEHAKWFPLCEFVLRQKGSDFVQAIINRFPNLRRPSIRNPASNVTIHQLRRGVQSGRRSMRNVSLTQTPIIVDPREEIRERNRKIEEEMTSSELVSHAKMMGFEDRMIRAALRRRFETANEGFSNLESFVEEILTVEAHIEDQPSSSLIDSDLEVLTPTASNLYASAGLEEMRRLEESRKCKICHNEPACIVFIPCGCLVCCVECGNRTRNCPICKTRVQKRIRSYIS